MKKKILLVDDHPVFRKGLNFILEDEEDMLVVGEAGDGQTALTLVEELSPDIVVMDVTMPGLNGIEATKQIVVDFPGTLVVALSIHSDKQFVQGMLQAGASGYILKESVPEELVKGIRSVMMGEGYLSPSITGIVVSGLRDSLSMKNSFLESGPAILETKLQAPTLPEHHVHRPRLVKILEKGVVYPIQMVIAPAGYGKSSLVSYWFSKLKLPHAWISMDKEENDLRQFICYFVHAIRTLFPGSMSQSWATMEGATLPPIQVLSRILVNEIDSIQQDFVLVLDDLHLLREKSIHDLLSELLRHPPKPLHLVIVGRVDPFLPLNRLRAQGQLSEIRLRELRFSESETVEFLQQLLKGQIDISISNDLQHRTEGWITGIRLEALSTLHRGDLNKILDELVGSSQFVMEYLFNEVYSSQPEYIQKYIVASSIRDRFCAPLCEVLSPYPENERDVDGWSLIKWLKEHNLFLVSLDDEGYWYRFHHLFHELLKKQLIRHYSSEEIEALHAKANIWFDANNLKEEAMESSALSISESLTSREKEILDLLVQGYPNKEIADKLFVSIDTVKTHLRNIYHKLGVKSRLQAVAKVKS